jgi:hypothetical protein
MSERINVVMGKFTPNGPVTSNPDEVLYYRLRDALELYGLTPKNAADVAYASTALAKQHAAIQREANANG